jgi:hypothetical protein
MRRDDGADMSPADMSPFDSADNLDNRERLVHYIEQ